MSYTNLQKGSNDIMRLFSVTLSVIILLGVLAGCGSSTAPLAPAPRSMHASLTPPATQADCQALHLAYTLRNDGDRHFSWAAQMNIADGALAEGITIKPLSGALDAGQSVTIAVAAEDQPHFPSGGSLAMIVNLMSADASFIKASITCT